MLFPQKQEPLIKSYYQGCRNTQTLCASRVMRHPLLYSRQCWKPQPEQELYPAPNIVGVTSRAKGQAAWVFVFPFPKAVPSIENYFRLLKTEKDGSWIAKTTNDRYAKCPEKMDGQYKSYGLRIWVGFPPPTKH